MALSRDSTPLITMFDFSPPPQLGVMVSEQLSLFDELLIVKISMHFTIFLERFDSP